MSKDTAVQIADDCDDCAEQYGDRPGTAGPFTMIDLYRTIARLARVVERQQAKIDHMMPDKSRDV